VAIRQWGINGLPTDDVSVDSGIVATRAQRWPLLIDPQVIRHMRMLVKVDDDMKLNMVCIHNG